MKISIVLMAMIFLVSLAAVAYACDYSFCSSIPCGCDKTCVDGCDGSYWYSNGMCSSECSNHCKYQTKECDKRCGAECVQCSDCQCPQNGCVGQDYYEYQPNCNDCKCNCDPVISVDDSRCQACDEVDCSNPACASEPKCAPCDASNVDCNVLACANNTQCLPCDTSNVDCSIPACASNPACTPSPPPPSGSGGMIISGGYIPPIIGPIAVPVVCGDGTCSYNETCASCPNDCLKQGNVCCKSIAYSGNCCTDSDCSLGYECNISKECQLVPTKACNESWACSDWSDCNKVAQSRVCIDANSCDSIKERPDLVQRCTTAGPTGMFLQNSALLEALALGITMFTILFFWRRHKKGTTVMPPEIVS